MTIRFIRSTAISSLSARWTTSSGLTKRGPGSATRSSCESPGDGRSEFLAPGGVDFDQVAVHCCVLVFVGFSTESTGLQTEDTEDAQLVHYPLSEMRLASALIAAL